MSVEAILESIEKLTLLEAAELVKAMEEKIRCFSSSSSCSCSSSSSSSSSRRC